MPKSVVLALAVVGFFTVTAPPPPAGAVTLEEVSRPTPVAAYAGVVAWSAFDAPTQLYRLRYSVAGTAPQDASVAPAPAPFEVDLGRGPGGRPRAVFSRCDTSDCDVWSLDDLAGGRPRRVRGAASAALSERAPSVDGDLVAFVATEPGARFPTVRVTNARTGKSTAAAALPRRFCRPSGCARRGSATATALELDRGRLALVYETPEGEGRSTEVLHLPREGREWATVAYTTSGALSKGEFTRPPSPRATGSCSPASRRPVRRPRDAGRERSAEGPAAAPRARRHRHAASARQRRERRRAGHRCRQQLRYRAVRSSPDAPGTSTVAAAGRAGVPARRAARLLARRALASCRRSGAAGRRRRRAGCAGAPRTPGSCPRTRPPASRPRTPAHGWRRGPGTSDRGR